MRRSSAVLLAVMIAFSAFPVVGAAAAESAAEGVTAGSYETAAEAELPSEENKQETANAEEDPYAVNAQEQSEPEEGAPAPNTQEQTDVGTEGSAAEEQGIAETESIAEDTSDQADAADTSATGIETAAEEGSADTQEQKESADTSATDTEAAAEEEPSDAQEGAPADEIAGEISVIEEETVQETAAEAKGAVNSFVNIDGKKYYFNAEGKKLSEQWLTVGDFTYYIGTDGSACTGFKKIGGKTYYFKDSRGSTKYPVGAMELGWQRVGSMKFYFADGGYPAIGNKYPGAMLTGWRRIGGNMYYFADTLYPSANRGRMMDGWRTISGRKYYFGSDGVRRTGFQKIEGKTYYFADPDYSEYTTSKQGVMLKALKKIGGKYYFFSEYGVMKTGWISYNGVLGFYKEDGTAANGWQKRGDDWYFLKENGIAHTGWLNLSDSSIYYLERARSGRMVDAPQKMSNGKMYFFDGDGRRATSTGWRNYGKYYYYTYSNGTCATSTEVNGIWLDENGRTEMTAMDIKAQGYNSSTNYLILVDRSIHKVGIYKGKEGNWINIKRYSCGDGKSSTPTIEGTFTVGIKLWYFDSGSARCWYATQFSGNYLFHSVLYYQNSYPADVMDGTLGAGVSHGCVRLEVSNARWIYDNIPRGTKVVVYH